MWKEGCVFHFCSSQAYGGGRDGFFDLFERDQRICGPASVKVAWFGDCGSRVLERLQRYNGGVFSFRVGFLHHSFTGVSRALRASSMALTIE